MDADRRRAMNERAVCALASLIQLGQGWPASSCQAGQECSYAHIQRRQRSFFKAKPYCCALCPAGFNFNSNLQLHMKTHKDRFPTSRKPNLNRTGEKPYKCDACPARFFASSSLKRHGRIHTGEEPYHCKTCSASFNKSENLEVHLRIHTGEKPCKCNLCQAAFSAKGTLTTHLRTHMGEKPHECDTCHASVGG